jgi:hypothetical protein
VTANDSHHALPHPAYHYNLVSIWTGKRLSVPKIGSIAEFVGREGGGRRRSMEKFQERNFPTELANAVGIRTSPTAPATGYEFKMESLRDKEE